MEELVVKFQVVEWTKAIVIEEAVEAWMWGDEVDELKQNCERELNAALPILKAAQDALD